MIKAFLLLLRTSNQNSIYLQFSFFLKIKNKNPMKWKEDFLKA